MLSPFQTPLVRRRALLSGLGAMAGALAASPLSALANTAWPSRTVRIIVPFAPGGAFDSSARVLAEVLSGSLGQTVIVENKPGAGSAIGVNHAAQSRDGHTLLMGSNSMVINPLLISSIGYDVDRDFDAVGMISAQPQVLVVPASSSIQSLDDLISQAKARPGQLTAGNSGNGTLAHIISEMFASQTRITLTPVPYKGESMLLPDLLGSLVSLGFLTLPNVLPHVKSGRLRALAVSSPQEAPQLPGVPTFRSLNYPSLEVQGWGAMFAPKGSIPAEGLARLESQLTTALQSETVKSKFESMNIAPVIRSRADTAAFMRAEIERYSAIIKARGIKAS